MIWKKVLRPKETIIEEFSLGRRYIFIIQLLIGLWGLLFIFFFPYMTMFALLFAFLTGWYLKESNAYAFSNKRVLIHRGWLSTRMTSVDYDKITDVVIISPFLNRIFLDTGHLLINTAGTPFHEVKLRNVENPYRLKRKLGVIIEEYDEKEKS